RSSALSSITSVIIATPGTFRIDSSQTSSTSNDFPMDASIFSSASKEAYKPLINSSSPLKTDNTMTSAIVPTATPIMDIRDSTVMKLRFFLLRKYRDAMKNERFKIKKSVFFFPIFPVFLRSIRDIQFGDHLIHVLGVSGRFVQNKNDFR